MKTITSKLIAVSVMVLMTVVSLSSCTTKKYYEYSEDSGLYIDTKYYYPHKSDFRWDDNLGRWYVRINDNSLTVYQLEDMEMAGTVLFGDYFSPMPFVESYYVDHNNGTYSQVVQSTGFEVTYGIVTFFVQTNERNLTWEDMPDEYEFKISLFRWR